MNGADFSQSQFVKSSQLLFNLTVDHSKYKIGVKILSVVHDKLLISSYNLHQLFIYTREGRYLSTVTTNDNEKIRDATWTPLGNIMYISLDNVKKVVSMSDSGEIITTSSQVTFTMHISVSDDIIYITDWINGAYQSADEGVSWNLIIKSTDGWSCLQVIKVTTDNFNDFWTWEQKKDDFRLRVYSVVGKNSDGNAIRRNITIPATDDKHINLLSSELSYDGKMNIFLSDNSNKAVHTFLLNGQYHCQLLLSHHIRKNPLSLAVDKKRQVLYIGQTDSMVQLFKLTYEEWGNRSTCTVKF